MSHPTETPATIRADFLALSTSACDFDRMHGPGRGTPDPDHPAIYGCARRGCAGCRRRLSASIEGWRQQASAYAHEPIVVGTYEARIANAQAAIDSTI